MTEKRTEEENPAAIRGSAVVFLDTETTGLSLDDDIWEFAAIRRESDGTEKAHHLFVQHGDRCEKLPEPFYSDHVNRFNEHGLNFVSQPNLAMYVRDLFVGRPHVVGAVPNFDTERLALLLRRHNVEPGWHYHLVDVENLAVGYLAAKGINVVLPWDSDDLTALLGLAPVPEDERHTAMGDARWAQRIYDHVMGQS